MGDNGKQGENGRRKTQKGTNQTGSRPEESKKNTDQDIEQKKTALYKQEKNTTHDIKGKHTVNVMSDKEYKKTASKKKDSLSKTTEQPLESIPAVYNDMKESCKVLYDLVVSIHNSKTKKVLASKEVIENFKEAQQIFEGLTKPQNAPYSNPSTKRQKRQASTLEKDKDDRIQLLQNENDKLKQEFENERKNHQLSKVDNSSTMALVERLEKDNQILKNELEAAEQTLKQKNEKLESKNKELESLGNELIIRSDIIEEIRGENETIRSNLAYISSERDKKIEEINELRNRLSRMSASKLEGDPNITDLGDPNRPLKLVERYQQLYDNLWTEAFGELIDSYTEINESYEKEKKAASEIITVVEGVIQFCEDVIRDQEITILSTLLCCTKDELDENNAHIHISTIRTIRKSIVHDTTPRLYKEFMNRQRNHDIKDCMNMFIEECLAICWTSLVQDPPMAFELDYCHGSVVDKDVMREFTVSGDRIDFVVWPAMRLTQSGPLMVKSVVQPIKKDSMKAN